MPSQSEAKLYWSARSTLKGAHNDLQHEEAHRVVMKFKTMAPNAGSLTRLNESEKWRGSTTTLSEAEAHLFPIGRIMPNH